MFVGTWGFVGPPTAGPCFLAIQLRALVARNRTAVQRSPEHPGPSNCVTCRRSNPGVKPMRLAVAIVMGWLKISATWQSFKLCSNFSKVVGYSFSCWSVETSHLQKLFVRRFSSNLAQHWVSLDLFATRSCSKRFSTQSLLMSSLDRFASALIGVLLGKSPGSDNINFFETVCSSLSSGRARKTLGRGRDDDDDPPCMTRVESVVQQTTPFFQVWFCLRGLT